MQEERIVVTGIGVISALGEGADATLVALRRRDSGIAPVKYLDTEHRDFLVGEVKMSNSELSQKLGITGIAEEIRTVLLGVAALREAVDSASLSKDDLAHAAFINGTTVGGMDLTEKHFARLYADEDASSEEMAWLQYNDCGCSTEMIADAVGGFRMVTTPSTACSSAANSMVLGADMIRAGVCDIVVAGGAEALSRFHLNGFNTLMILDKERCRPFDLSRAGINLGEGAAYLVLERESSALRRGAKPLAILSGYGNSCDAFHQTATSPDGEGAYRSMTKALTMANVNIADIDYINAHGTGTPNNDQCEYAAMERIWGEDIPPFTSTKSLTGHTTSASGSIESVICILAMQNRFMPAGLGFETPLKENAVAMKDNIEDVDVRHAVCNAFGFGGNDTTLILSRYEG